ncbi:MAG: tRNA lysidine(34) synthetase TilS, partial [Pseudomonadota bacterium]|nr:tRNA lysidine(34) synthetase TilS [Pseudomonadota bacterium]
MQSAEVIPELLERELSRLIPGWPAARLGIALSGGVDSSALLHACHRIRLRQPAVSLRALHVAHGLQPAAADWPAICAALCASLEVPFETIELDFAPLPGASVEAAARDARYAALQSRLAPGEALLTAHHQDDQLETVLLQLFRGAGLAGISAMPESAPFGQGLLLRPLLGVTRADIDAYAHANGIGRIEDPTNLSPRFDRGMLRRDVIPVLRARWPSLARTVSRTARHAATAQGLLDELAAMDAADGIEGNRLLVAYCLGLPRARQANLLRWWLQHSGLGMPSEARLNSLIDDLLPARAGAQPVVTWPNGEVRRHRGWLHAMRPLKPLITKKWVLGVDKALEADGVGAIALVPGIGCGFSSLRYPGPFELRVRQGGERLLPVGQRVEKSVTRLLREAGTAPWLRDRVPLVYSGG